MYLSLGLMLFAFAWLQPMHIRPWVSWHSEVIAFMAALTMGLSLLIQERGRKDQIIIVPSLVLPFVILGAICCLQYMLGLLDFRGDLFTYLSYILVSILCILVGYNQQQSRVIFKIALAVLFSAVFSALIILAQVFEVWEGNSWIHRVNISRRPGGNLGQPNQVATLLLMGLASLIFLREKAKLSIALFAVVSVLLMFTIVITESRTAVISFFVLMLWWYWFIKGKITGESKILVLISSIAFACLKFLWAPFYTELFQLEFALQADALTSRRWTVWPQLLQAVWLKPWWGWGVTQISKAHNAVVDTYLMSEPYTYAHNIVLDFALGFGLPMTLLFSVAAGIWLIRRMQLVNSVQAWFCLAFIAPLMVHSMLEFPYTYSYFLFPAMFVLGILESSLNTASKLAIHRHYLIAAMCIASFFLIWSIVEYIAVEEDYRIVRFESLKVGRTPADYERPKVFLFTQMDGLLKANRIAPRPDMTNGEIETARTAALKFPWIAIQNRYALALALNGNAEEAIRQLKVIRALHGEKHYLQLKAAWVQLANEKYPQLAALQMP